MIFAIDPGNTGAIAELTTDGALHAVHDMPVVDGWVNPQLLARLEALVPTHVVVEQARSMPKQGVASTFKYGVGYGVILGVFCDIPMTVVPSSRWKKQMRLAGKDKDAARAAAIAQWPGRADWFGRVMDHGRAEAALLGLWWLRHGQQ